jgi:nucleoside-diphosphate-sugar epimerase
MRTLVTGHRGYIGTVMVPHLLAAGHDVVGLDSDLFADCSFDEGGITPIPEIRKDLRDVGEADLDGFDAVVHLANLSNDPLGDLDPRLTEAINHHATVRLARLARQRGVRRFLFASSCSLYGAAGQAAVDERAPMNPVTAYGRCKASAEAAIARLATDDFSPVFFRNATAYGASPRLRFDLVLNNLTAWAVATGAVRMKSDGSPWRPLVHIEDISRAFLAGLEAPQEAVHKEAFNVGRDDENYRVREIAELVGRVVPDCEVTFAEGAEPDTRSYRVSFAKIAERLPAFRPQWTASRGVEQVYAALKDAGIGPDEFEGPRYKRIATIRRLLAEGSLGADLRWRQAEEVPA